MKNRGTIRLVAAAAATVSGMAVTAQSADAALVYGVTTDNTLFSFQDSSPGTILNGVPITGFQVAGEQIRGIDFRPSTGQLFALGSSGQLYTLNKLTGALTDIGARTPINGTAFGFDFNPVIDRIRVVSNTDSNYVYNPNDGSKTTVTNLFYGPGDLNVGVNPNVVGSAYTNSTFGAAAGSTQLYGIESGLDILVTQANSAGTLGSVGPLGVDTSALVGFDILSSAGGGNIAYASLTPSGGSVSNFYSINLITGAAANLGQIDGGIFVTDIAVEIVPEPAALGFLGLAAVAALGRRRA
jgi:hypothetical protein